MQIAQKTEDVHFRLRQMVKHLGTVYPTYNGLIAHRSLKHDGFICEVNKFVECPYNERFAKRCNFSIGKCTYCWYNLSTAGWCVIYLSLLNAFTAESLKKCA